MEKALGTRLLDGIKEIMELENAKTELMSALYLRKIDQRVETGIQLIESSLKSQASVYGVNYENYSDRVKKLILNYTNEIDKLRDEYEFQFVNLQLELREALANQKIAIVNAKKIVDTKSEFIESDKYKAYIDTKNTLSENLNNALEKDEHDKYYNMIEALVDPTEIYDQKKMTVLKKYNDYNSLIKSCERKIKYCINETLSEIDKITNENIENSLLVPNGNKIMKIISKVQNMFSGKTKFENRIKLIEINISDLASNSDEKLEEIRNNTIELVAEIQVEKDNLKVQVA